MYCSSLSKCLRGIPKLPSQPIRHSSSLGSRSSWSPIKSHDRARLNPEPRRRRNTQTHEACYHSYRHGSTQSFRVSDKELESLFASSLKPSRKPPTNGRYSGKALDGITEEDRFLAFENSGLAVTEWESAFKTKIEEVDSPKGEVARQSGELLVRGNLTLVEAFVGALRDLKNELLRDEASPAEIWHKCKFILKSPSWTKVSRAIQGESDEILSTFREILYMVVRKKRIKLRDGAILHPKDVLSFYSEKGVIKGWWHDVLWIQLSHLARFSATNAVSRDKVEEQLLLQDVIETWAELFKNLYKGRQRRTALSTREPTVDTAAGERHENWDHLPRLMLAEEEVTALPSRLSLRVQSLLGVQGSSKHMQEVASAALMTLHYWQKIQTPGGSQTSPSSTEEPFLNRLRMLAQNVEWDCRRPESCMSMAGESERVIDVAKEDWANSPIPVIAQSYRRAVEAPTESHDSPLWSEHDIKRFFAYTNKLKERSDAIAATKLWDETKPRITRLSPPDEELRSTIFARFLRLFYDVGQAANATDVWNYMIQIGHRPGLRHWNAMLSGCSYVRDVASLQSIWSNLQKTRIRPDNELWTTYVHGVIKANKPQQGLQLLEDLGKEWKDPRSSLTPDLGPVHGALSAFQTLDWGRDSIVRMHATILQWARSQSLVLSVHTYNILLATVVRKSNPKEISGHLAAMAADNCTPDVYTYTIILKGLLATKESPFHDLNHTDQMEYIESVLAEMEAKSIRPTPQTYSTIVFGLLNNQKGSAPNVSAARVVLTHMEQTGVPPSQHIHTILLTHYFSLSPPDLPAVDSLLASILRGRPSSPKTSTGHLNNFFWNRVIMGYAACDEWEKSLHYLRKLPNQARSPYWTGLRQLLRALARAEEWDLCSQVVDGVERGQTMKWADRENDNRRGGFGWEGYNMEVEELRVRGLIPSIPPENSVGLRA